MSIIYPGHFVAIFGAGVAGVEAAYQLAGRGIQVALFEQYELPYGKIEEGLPKWHYKLRNKEEARIDEKLKEPNIHLIPLAKLGDRIDFQEIAHDWGFSAILLATGAWRDRPLPITGIEQYIGKGLYYQNDFVSWFNHNHEPDYQGAEYPVADNGIVVGGGLASFDVVKILMLETTGRALARRGHEVDMFTLERKGIAQVLTEFGLSLADLGISGCTLYYRRRFVDMPLAPMPDNPNPKVEEKIHFLRKRIFDNFQQKYLFQARECMAPVEKIAVEGRLAGIVFQKTDIANGELKYISGETIEVQSPITVSSIGSLPEPLEGVTMQGELFHLRNTETGQVEGYENVFALGNAVTGRGNIRESLTHGRQVSRAVMEYYLSWGDDEYHKWIGDREQQVDGRINKIAHYLQNHRFLESSEISSILERIKKLQQEVEYDGNYAAWIEKHTPPRLEQLIPVPDGDGE